MSKISLKGAMRFSLYTICFVLFSFAAQAQTGTVKGRITDKKGAPVANATVSVKGTTKSVKSDENGRFSINNSAASGTLVVTSIGYSKQEIKFSSEKDVTVVLAESVKSEEEVVVTGVFDKRTALNSSIAISTLSKVQIERQAPNSAADLLKNVPGVYVNSSLGEIRNSVTSRGMSTGNNDGRWGYDYVSIQEDGLPVTTSNMANYGPDFFLRADATLEKVEAVRGGTASIVGANAPGGIFNYISKTGGDKFEGEARARFGLEGNGKNPYYRADIDFGGPFGKNKNLTYNIGGFYRRSEGARNPGYASNYGGQVKGNILYKYKTGSLKFLVKLLNDHNLGEEALPVTDFNSPTLVPGFSNSSSALIPSFKTTVNVPTLGNVEYDPAKLWHSRDTKFGMNWEQNLGKGWKFTNNMSFTHKNWDGYSPEGTVTAMDMTNLVTYIILGTVNPQPAGPPAAVAVGDYSFKTGGKEVMHVNSQNVPLFPGAPPFLVIPIFNVTSNTSAGASFAPNSLLFTPLIYQHHKNSEFFNQFNFNKKVKNSTFNIGGFIGHSTLNRVLESFGLTINTFQNHPQPLVITLTDPSNKVYQVTNSNGVAKVGADQGVSLFKLAQTQMALFFAHTWQINKQLNLDWGLRYESLCIKGTNNPGTVNPVANGGADGNPLTLYDNFTNAYGADLTYNKTKQYLSYSAALNYKISDNAALYARFSNGKKAPGFQIYTDVSTSFAQQTLDPQIQNINQFELGFKSRYKGLTTTITPFYSVLSHIPSNVTFTNEQTGLLYNPPALYETIKTYGVELEGNYQVSNHFSVRGVLTLQNSKATTYQSWMHIDRSNPNRDSVVDNSGNKAANTPNVMMNLTPEYSNDKFYANITWSYMGKRQANFANAWQMPAFSQFNLAMGYNFSSKFKLSANINNLFNNYGVMGWVTPGSFPFNLNLEGYTKANVSANPNAFYEAFSIPSRAYFLTATYKF